MRYNGKPLSPTLSPLVPRGEREKTKRCRRVYRYHNLF